MKNNFYKQFEDRFRGSRELILERLRGYTPFLTLLLKVHKTPKAIDLGCGRGEWLELISSLGYDAHGVDLDAGMLQNAKDYGLNVEIGDAIAYLKALPAQSMTLITGFHLVEHLPFESLHILVEESLRVLEKGGLLILETPNPENIVVATSQFYLDPTHIKPIPPELLEFLPTYYGFARTKILRLQHDERLSNNQFVNILQLLGGVSPDYAIVAQKKATKKILDLFDPLFSKEYGLSLDMLALKFEHRMLHFEAQFTQIQQIQQQAEAQFQIFTTQIAQTQQQVDIATTNAQEAWEKYYAVLNSHSWKITRPLRESVRIAKWFTTGAKAWLTFSPKSRPRRVLTKWLMYIMHYASTNAFLKYNILKILNRFPNFKFMLKKWLPKGTITSSLPQNTITVAHLSSRAQEVYFELKKISTEAKKGSSS